MNTLKDELEKQGWKLIKVTKFKHHDRIVIRKSSLDISANLRGKQEDYSIQEIVSALTGEGEKHSR